MSEPLLPFDPAVYEAVTGLRTVRRFRPEPLSDELVRAILDAGRWTGSSKNRQAWAFVVVRQRIRLDRLADCGTSPSRFAEPPSSSPPSASPTATTGTSDDHRSR